MKIGEVHLEIQCGCGEYMDVSKEEKKEGLRVSLESPIKGVWYGFCNSCKGFTSSKDKKPNIIVDTI